MSVDECKQACVWICEHVSVCVSYLSQRCPSLGVVVQASGLKADRSSSLSAELHSTAWKGDPTLGTAEKHTYTHTH